MKKNRTPKLKVKKKSGCLSKFLIGIVVLVILSMFGGSEENDTLKVPDYNNVSNSEYSRDGKKCISYRVSISPDVSDDELTAVFNEVCKDDYYLHTVFFYSSDEKADGSDTYDVAMLEENTPDSSPIITRATVSEDQPVRSWLAEHENQTTESDTLAELVTLPEIEEIATESAPPEESTREEITEAETEVETEISESTTQEERTYTYVLNTSTKKIHYSDCASVSSIKPKNYDEWTGHSASEFLESHSNYSACGRCHPY